MSLKNNKHLWRGKSPKSLQDLGPKMITTHHDNQLANWECFLWEVLCSDNHSKLPGKPLVQNFCVLISVNFAKHLLASAKSYYPQPAYKPFAFNWRGSIEK